MIEVPTFTAQIYCGLREGYAGRVHPAREAKKLARTYCDEAGLCVTVTKTVFAYTDGTEPGVIIGLINYPRFPSSPETIRSHAIELANRFKSHFNQNRVSVVFSDVTVMVGDAE